MRSQRPNEPVSETPPRAVSALRARRGTGLRLGAILPMLALAAWLVSPQPGFLVAAFLLPALLAISVDRGGREIRSGIDALTGLEDRAGLVEALAAELGRAPYSGGDVAVLTLEIDRYKAFEQRLDRSALDHLLRQTARRLTRNSFSISAPRVSWPFATAEGRRPRSLR